MRTLLHLGMFALAITAATQADAQGRGRGPESHETPVVTETHRVPGPPHWRRTHPDRSRGAMQARLHVEEQRRDHEAIVRIARRWRRASYERNPYAKRHATLRANAWIDREIAESRGLPGRRHYVLRLRALRGELRSRSYGYRPRPRVRHARTASVLDELVELSAHELHRAELRARRHVRHAFSMR